MICATSLCRVPLMEREMDIFAAIELDIANGGGHSTMSRV